MDKNRNPYPTTPIVDKGPIPDPFAHEDGRRVQSRDAWPARAAAWRELVVGTEYGGMPPAADAVTVEPLCHTAVKRWDGQPRLLSYRVHCHGGEKPFSFAIRILAPQSDNPVPAIVNGDGCYWYITEDIAQRVLSEGCALVMFNRTEMAEDRLPADDQKDPRRTGGLYDVYPGLSFGALAAWAWGYHRCVDAILSLNGLIDATRIAVTGHSRGAKTTLLAGATDERITLVNDNASCAAGSALFRYVGDGGETLGIVNHFLSWFGPKPGLRPFVGREEVVPFDQHCLLATIAPRPLLLTYALDDRWSNPEGMVQCATATREVYRFLDAENKFAFHLRPGGHQHAPEDWDVLLDFIGVQWGGCDSSVPYNRHPYDHLKPAFSWSAPTP